MFDERALQFLVETMGAERVMLGSDYPFPLGEHRVGTLIRSSRLTAPAKLRLLGGNAVDFLGSARPERGNCENANVPETALRSCRRVSS